MIIHDDRINQWLILEYLDKLCSSFFVYAKHIFSCEPFINVNKSHYVGFQTQFPFLMSTNPPFIASPIYTLCYSSIVFMHSHPPFNFSLNSLTLLSPVLTAKTLPLRLQLALHATASKLSVVDCQSPAASGAVDVQIRTVLSCEAEAIYDLERTVGDHETSRTQSAWPERVVMRLYVWPSVLFDFICSSVLPIIK